jgi:hypothetical protein
MKIKPEEIDSIVSRIAGISVERMHSNSQKQVVTDARNLSMLKCQEYLKLSSLKLQKHFGKDSHTTILSDLKSAKNLIETDPMARDRAANVDHHIKERIQELTEIRKRYNLHYRIRQKGYRIDMKSKTVSIRLDQEESLQEKQFVKLLKRHGYNVQYSIIF